MRYGSTDVLNGVSLHVQRGQVVALLGPNGAGKTTMIEILEGFRSRSAGQVTVLGVDPFAGGQAWRARVGIVLQSWRDHGKRRVREFLANQGSLYVPYATVDEPRPWNVETLLAAVGLADQPVNRCVGCPVGNDVGSTWLWAWSGGRSCYFSTSPPPGSTPGRAETFTICFNRRPPSSR